VSERRSEISFLIQKTDFNTEEETFFA